MRARPIRTQRLIYDEEIGLSVIRPVDGWSTGRPCWVITPSTTDYPPIGYILRHVPTGFAVGPAFPVDGYRLDDIAHLAGELDKLLDWRRVTAASTFNDEKYTQTARLFSRFLREHSQVLR